MPRGTLALVVAGSIAATLPAAEATTCIVDLQRAVDEAMKRGWRFQCKLSGSAPVGSSVAFAHDAMKRPGCAGRTGPVPGMPYLFRAQFFKHVSRSQLANGWSFESFQAGSGQFNPYPPMNGALLVYGWDLSQPNRNTARHLLELKLKKSGGNCAKVYEEAFG